MKFNVKQITCNQGRRGIISNFERLPDTEIETPNMLLYTQGGSVPHLTPDSLDLIYPKPQAILITIPTIASLQERMHGTTMNIAQFVGLPNLITTVSLIDPGRPRLEGFHKQNFVAVQTRSGKKDYSPSSFMDFISVLKPDLFTSLCDSDTKKDCSSKRLEKSFTRSRDILAECATKWTECEQLRRSSLIVPLGGGFDVKTREAYATSVNKYNEIGVSGVLIDGLGQHGDDVTSMVSKDVEQYVRASITSCEIKGVRILLGAWHPSVVLDLVEIGVDVFDSSYPNLVTDRGCAICLPLNDVEGQPPSKRAKPPNFEISLKEKKNAECFEPISADCACHCCKNHTRAYIHHLLNVNEMLASVLLNIHNLQQYMKFFEAIRHSQDNNTFEELKNKFL